MTSNIYNIVGRSIAEMYDWGAYIYRGAKPWGKYIWVLKLYIKAMDWPTVLYIIYSIVPLITYMHQECKGHLRPTYSLAYKCHHFII